MGAYVKAAMNETVSFVLSHWGMVCLERLNGKRLHQQPAVSSRISQDGSKASGLSSHNVHGFVFTKQNAFNFHRGVVIRKVLI